MSHEDCKNGHWNIFNSTEDFCSITVGVLKVGLPLVLAMFYLVFLGPIGLYGDE